MLHAAHAVQDEVETRLSGIGLSGAKFAALKALSDAAESLPLSQLAERLSCVKSNITQLVDRLEADGLVARKPDPHDRRTKLAVLTATGRKAVKDGAPDGRVSGARSVGPPDARRGATTRCAARQDRKPESLIFFRHHNSCMNDTAIHEALRADALPPSAGVFPWAIVHICTVQSLTTRQEKSLWRP